MMSEDPPPPISQANTSPEGEQSPNPPRRLLPWIGRMISVRLRFLVVLGVASAVVAGWDIIVNAWDRVVRGAIRVDISKQIVSGDTEYFCPMDPGVLGDWPGKCPICNMSLVRRVRGDATPLPEGVIARMQLSPYRIQLAGIRTALVDYKPLTFEVEGPGHVLAPAEEGAPTAEVEVDVFPSDLPRLAEGQLALVITSWADPLRGTIRTIGTETEANEGSAEVVLEVADPNHRLRPGTPVRARLVVPMASVEPFRSAQSEPPPLRKGERRRAYVCDEHIDVVRETTGVCPNDQRELTRRDLEENQRLRWWCPMHPNVTSDRPGGRCEACGGMILAPRIVSYAPRGQVLAVPETAVVDTGTRRVVYVERMAGMFDGVEVVLGPRCGDSYPVIRGLEPGQRVVETGTFLVDAETRLNPNVAASYFGASGRQPATASAPVTDQLDTADRALIARQKNCPVTGKPLGSMGTPVRLEIQGRVVFLCCEGCTSRMRKDPSRYLAKLPPDAKPAP